MPPTAASTSPPPERLAPWQVSLRRAVRDPIELCRQLELDVPQIVSSEANAAFPLLVPLEYLAKIEPGNARDPLLVQILPAPHETRIHANFTANPVGDHEAQQIPGLLWKYGGRVLLLPTLSCAVHCRYCFRRNYLDASFFSDPVTGGERSAASRTTAASLRWREACRFISAEQSIREVILSGGDPLMVPDEQLAHWIEQLASIPHLTTLRIHTRLPVTIPSRVDCSLLAWLEATRLQTVVVLHANHPREIDHAVGEAARRLQQAGCTVLNQSVLLQGVNDSSDTLIELSRRLIAAGILPYYLHQLDQAHGTAHFHVPIETGRRIVARMRKELPGYLVPRYVQEIAGAEYKTPLA